MRRRLALAAVVVAAALSLGGCESFDPTEWFNTKKPLPGDRKELFPGGVPGVPQGVPPELVEGYKPPAETPPQDVVEDKPKPKPKAKPRPKPQQAARPAQPRPQVTAGAPPQPQGQAAWPDPQQTAGQPAPAQGGPMAFPDPPRR